LRVLKEMSNVVTSVNTHYTIFSRNKYSIGTTKWQGYLDEWNI